MRILFVSERNRSRSQIAEALVTLLGREGTEAWSAGLDPADEIDGNAVEAMRELGVDISRQQPKGLEALPDSEFDVVVAINWPEDEVLVKARMHLDWDVPETEGLSLREVVTIRQLLKSKIERLLTAPFPA